MKTFRSQATIAAIILLAGMCLPVVPPQHAQTVAGRLDATFGAGGVETADINGGDDEATAVLVQPDGKIVVAGRDGAPVAMFTVIRYLPDGRLDTGFGEGGKARIAVINQFSYATSITRLADGGLVVGGYVLLNDGRQQLALVKLTADGQRDMSFGQIGYVIGPLFPRYDNADTRVQKVVAQADGKLLLVGHYLLPTMFPYFTYSSPFMYRLLADGSLDPSFGFGGAGFGGGDDLLIQSDGKILSAGSGCAVARLNPNGSSDQSFGGPPFPGAVGTDHLGGVFDNALATAPAVAVAPDGKVVLACSVTKPRTVLEDDFALVRFNGDGSLDTGFGTNGVTVVDVGTNDHVKDLLAQPDGKIVLAGYSGTDDPATHLPAQAHVTLLRFNTDGSLDQDFKIEPLPTDQNSVDVANAAALQSDGRIVVAGSVRTASGSDMFVARYLSGLVIAPPPVTPDFSLVADPATVNGTPGSKVRFTIKINRVGGFVDPVAVGTVLDPRLRLASDGPSDGQSYNYILKIKGKMPAGTYPLVFTGSDQNGRKRGVTVTLVVS